MNRPIQRRLFLRRVLGAGLLWPALRSSALDAPPSPSGAADLTVTSQILQPDWRGFGYQDTLFLWMDHQGHRVTDDDIKLNVERVRALRPSVVRLFTIMPWWNPRPNVMEWDSEAMKNLYQVLDLYKSLGTEIALTVWGRLPDWIQAPGNVPSEKAGFARSVAAFLDHLLREKGYKEIKYLLIYNEPDLEFKPPEGDAFAGWSETVRTVRQYLRRFGVRIQLMGPDDALSADWLKQATETMGDVLDGYDSHHYDATAEGAERWIAERMAIVRASPHPKPWWITEFGRVSGRDDYDYGLFVARYGVAGLNAGVGAMLLWDLIDMYFPGEQGLNDWGLWRYQDRGWKPRPVFYLYGLLTRYAGRDLQVRGIAGGGESLPAAYLSGRAGETLIVANPGAARAVTVAGLPEGRAYRRYRYTEAAVSKASGQPLSPEEAVKPAGSLQDQLPERSVTVWTTVKE